MTRHDKPIVLAIDDRPDATRADFGAANLDDIEVNVTHPQDVTEAMLEEADLVLVDYQIDDWDERATQPISMAPANGLALAVVLREHADFLGGKSGRTPTTRPSAFALHSGHLGEILGRLREQPKPHLIAKLNNLEWAFSKTDPDRFRGMQRLATAVRELPNPWPKTAKAVANRIQTMLGLDSEAPSYERCWQDVLASRAPVDVLTREGHSTVPLRWLLHQVLPYPTFLWAQHWVAARLSLTMSGFEKLREGDSTLQQDLVEIEYAGVLSDFFGVRWWKGALEDYVWELVGGRPSAREAIRFPPGGSTTELGCDLVGARSRCTGTSRRN